MAPKPLADALKTDTASMSQSAESRRNPDLTNAGTRGGKGGPRDISGSKRPPSARHLKLNRGAGGASTDRH
jgi:hypothetical protein